MRLYAEQIKLRDEVDHDLEQRADKTLVSNHVSVTTGVRDAQEALSIILDWMGIDSRVAIGCKSIDEMLERTLSLRTIMFEEVDTTEDSWKRHADIALGHLEDGPYVALRPGLFGYRCADPSTGKETHLGKRLRLARRDWTFVRPIPH